MIRVSVMPLFSSESSSWLPKVSAHGTFAASMGAMTLL